MPANEAWQLALGLTIPFLLISHPVGIRLGEFQYGRELGYLPVLNKFWVVSPDFALPRQLLLLLVLWIHGCIGLRAWLRTNARTTALQARSHRWRRLFRCWPFWALSTRDLTFARRCCAIRSMPLLLVRRRTAKKRNIPRQWSGSRTAWPSSISVW